MTINMRALMAFGHDLMMTGFAFFIALHLRLSAPLDTYLTADHFPAWVVLLATSAFIYQWLGLYRGIWRYASMDDLIALTKAVSLVVAVFVVANFAWTRLENIPRSVPIILWFVMMVSLGAPRFVYRTIKDQSFRLVGRSIVGNGVPVLLVGASDGAELFLRHLTRSRTDAYSVVGIVSITSGRVGRRIHGAEVLGTIDDIVPVLKGLSAAGRAPHRIILTKDDFSGGQISALLDAAVEHGASMARLPRLTDLQDHQNRLEVRPIAVEDLLGRPQTPLNREEMLGLVRGRRILITGAGGSIGSELVRQVSLLSPAHLTCLDVSEANLYTVSRDLEEAGVDFDWQPVLRDVRDRTGLSRAIQEAKPDIIFHAAALKHVPIVEAEAEQGVLTNVLGTLNVSELAVEFGVSLMVLISTDKAVNPTNIMGATKRIAEQICQGLDVEDTKTRFVTVRFGNVLGSTGSVVPMFQRQLAAGGPLTVTHPDMTRYFMTIREAVELVLEASALGFESSDRVGVIYVLDMGEPVKIIDLARQMIRLAGYDPEKDIDIEIIGIRPGEKIFEEVFHRDESLISSRFPGILLARPRSKPLNTIRPMIDMAIAHAAGGERHKMLSAVSELVPEHQAAKHPES